MAYRTTAKTATETNGVRTFLAQHAEPLSMFLTETSSAAKHAYASPALNRKPLREL
jgi:hypothetical protein